MKTKIMKTEILKLLHWLLRILFVIFFIPALPFLLFLLLAVLVDEKVGEKDEQEINVNH